MFIGKNQSYVIPVKDRSGVSRELRKVQTPDNRKKRDLHNDTTEYTIHAKRPFKK